MKLIVAGNLIYRLLPFDRLQCDLGLLVIGGRYFLLFLFEASW
jgi:hypothetical protein